uniref:C2H2-type domain-containing protein n=1 Tax=Enterobius vermicularis TaxID=51028 RepID=A0A0N4V942_ENTVE
LRFSLGHTFLFVSAYLKIYVCRYVDTHFECLHPLEDVNVSKRMRGVKSRSKNLLCKWDNCEMGLSRGDLRKQFSWLKEHFLTRHFRKAKPYCCLIDGCSARFSFKRALEDHLRTGHDKGVETYLLSFQSLFTFFSLFFFQKKLVTGQRKMLSTCRLSTARLLLYFFISRAVNRYAGLQIVCMIKNIFYFVLSAVFSKKDGY